jgi:hypothetical protein
MANGREHKSEATAAGLLQLGYAKNLQQEQARAGIELGTV